MLGNIPYLNHLTDFVFVCKLEYPLINILILNIEGVSKNPYISYLFASRKRQCMYLIIKTKVKY